MKQGSAVVWSTQPDRSNVPSAKHALRIKISSAWGEMSIFFLTDSTPSAMSFPSGTTKEPKGVSPLVRATLAYAIALLYKFHVSERQSTLWMVLVRFRVGSQIHGCSGLVHLDLAGKLGTLWVVLPVSELTEGTSEALNASCRVASRTSAHYQTSIRSTSRVQASLNSNHRKDNWCLLTNFSVAGSNPR